LRSGNIIKSIEHLQLSLDLADDADIRAIAENLLRKTAETDQGSHAEISPVKGHGCATCSPSSHNSTVPADASAAHLSESEQFHLLINTLPGDLPQRYSLLGDDFASAYLLAHAERTAEALHILKGLLVKSENDIFLYEAALLYFRSGDPVACENLLKQALQVNSANPLIHLGLAQLYVDSERYDEASVILNSMLTQNVLPEQALMMLADVYTLQGYYDQAIAVLTPALDSPALKKASAERLVRLLTAQGRHAEAEFLIKSYLKGCC
jgi:predicted Zn-dependent protease